MRESVTPWNADTTIPRISPGAYRFVSVVMAIIDLMRSGLPTDEPPNLRIFTVLLGECVSFQEVSMWKQGKGEEISNRIKRFAL